MIMTLRNRDEGEEGEGMGRQARGRIDEAEQRENDSSTDRRERAQHNGLVVGENHGRGKTWCNFD